MGAMFITSGLLKRRGLGAPAKSGPAPRIDVVARRGLGKHAAVAIVRTGGRDLVVGITEQSVTLLREAQAPLSAQISIDLDDEDLSFAEADNEPVAVAAPTLGANRVEDLGSQRTALPNGGQFATPSQAWKAMLENLRERSVRR